MKLHFQITLKTARCQVEGLDFAEHVAQAEALIEQARTINLINHQSALSELR